MSVSDQPFTEIELINEITEEEQADSSTASELPSVLEVKENEEEL